MIWWVIFSKHANFCLCSMQVNLIFRQTFSLQIYCTWLCPAKCAVNFTFLNYCNWLCYLSSVDGIFNLWWLLQNVDFRCLSKAYNEYEWYGGACIQWRAEVCWCPGNCLIVCHYQILIKTYKLQAPCIKQDIKTCQRYVRALQPLCTLWLPWKTANQWHNVFHR